MVLKRTKLDPKQFLNASYLSKGRKYFYHRQEERRYGEIGTLFCRARQTILAFVILMKPAGNCVMGITKAPPTTATQL